MVPVRAIDRSAVGRSRIDRKRDEFDPEPVDRSKIDPDPVDRRRDTHTHMLARSVGGPFVAPCREPRRARFPSLRRHFVVLSPEGRGQAEPLGRSTGAYTVMRTEIVMGNSNRIEVNPEIMLGKPVIRGTRITVELLLRKLSEGATEEELLEAYPHLTREDIKAAIAYAADTIAHERHRTLKARS